jgi:hypothetical protein
MNSSSAEKVAEAIKQLKSIYEEKVKLKKSCEEKIVLLLNAKSKAENQEWEQHLNMIKSFKDSYALRVNLNRLQNEWTLLDAKYKVIELPEIKAEMQTIEKSMSEVKDQITLLSKRFSDVCANTSLAYDQEIQKVKKNIPFIDTSIYQSTLKLLNTSLIEETWRSKYVEYAKKHDLKYLFTSEMWKIVNVHFFANQIVESKTLAKTIVAKFEMFEYGCTKCGPCKLTTECKTCKKGGKSDYNYYLYKSCCKYCQKCKHNFCQDCNRCTNCRKCLECKPCSAKKQPTGVPRGCGHCKVCHLCQNCNSFIEVRINDRKCEYCGQVRFQKLKDDVNESRLSRVQAAIYKGNNGFKYNCQDCCHLKREARLLSSKEEQKCIMTKHIKTTDFLCTDQKNDCIRFEFECASGHTHQVEVKSSIFPHPETFCLDPKQVEKYPIDDLKLRI